MKTDILLIFPPCFYPHMPYLALPMLKAYLEKNGIITHQVDLNVLAYEYFLSKKYVEKAYAKVVKKAGNNYKGQLPKRLELTSSGAMRYVIDYIEDAIAAIQGEKHTLPQGDDPQKIIDLGLDIVSDAYFPTELGFAGFKVSYSNRSSKQVYEAIRNSNENIFVDFYRESIPPIFDSFQPNYIGVSITVPDQIIPTFSLCKVIREIDPNKKIILGGNIITRLKEFFTSNNCLNDLYDFCILEEGEKSLLNFIQKNGEKNVFDKTSERFWEVFQKVNPNSIPCPAFDDLPLDKYFDKALILPLLASRRCYWDKCLFCSISAGYSSGYRKASAQNVVDNIETLMQKYNTRFFKFVDDAASPHLLKNISEEILARGLDVYWEAYTILEQDFTDKDFCKMLFSAGCRWLYFGLETANIRVAKNMNKPIRKCLPEDVLQTVKEAGISTHIWVIIGYPSDSRIAVDDTVKFIERNKSVIDSVEVNQFALTKGAPIMGESILSKFEISPILRDEEDIALTYDFEVIKGISQEEAQQLTKEVRKHLGQDLGYVNAVRTTKLLANRFLPKEVLLL